MQDRRFQEFAREKTRQANIARIQQLSTVYEDLDTLERSFIGNAWSREHYAGDFGLVRLSSGQTAVSLVFVQTRDGNTGGPSPGALGGGETDTHLIYEGLSRVAADAVLAGAGSLDENTFFSVWHPELIALRSSLGLPRHPAQIVVSQRGTLDEETLLFNVPDVPVFLILGEEGVARLGPALASRPWVRRMPLDPSGDLRPILDRLRQEDGVRRISAVGGRSTATRLVDAGLVQDLYLTTTAKAGGDAGTPWYSGTRAPRVTVLTRKEWLDEDSCVVFEHSSLS